MNILHLASEYPKARIFGLGRYVHDCAGAQARRGHEVHVLTNSLSGKEQDAVANGVHVHRINFPSPPMPPDGATQVTQFNFCLYERLLEIEPVLGRVDVVVAHDWLTVLAADLVRKRLGARLVLTVHDTVIGKTFGRMTNEDRFIANVERWGCRLADAVIAVSGHVKSELLGVYEAPPDRVHVVPCGVSPAWFEALDGRFLADLRATLATPDEKILAYVGRLDPEKGVDRLLEAFAAVRRAHTDARLVIAGKGGEQPKLEEQASRLGVREHVRFLGYVTGPALEAIYKVSTVLVCPSTYEPFGIVPLEGMINRVPVVVSDTGGMAEIVEHERSGLKVSPGDAGALAHALRRLLDDSALARRLTDGGYERARTIYSWDRVAEMTEPIYSGRPAAHREAPSTPHENGDACQDAARPAHRDASNEGGQHTHPAPSAPPSRARPKLTAGIRVKNGERYAEECLRDLSEYVDEIVVLDDGSTDRTIEILRSFPKVTSVVRWEKSFFHEGIDRNVVIALVKNTNPDWILLPDIDEVFEDRFKRELPRLMAADGVDMYAFLFCHFWRSRTHYRVDGKWGRETREFPIPRLVRNAPGLHYPVHRPLGTAQIAGVAGRVVVSDIRVRHYGHMHEDISRAKVALYSSLDPGVDYSYMVDEAGLQLEEWKE